MQLNIYVPEGKKRIVEALDEVARRTGRPKNELALDAIEAFLAQARPQLGRHHLGSVKLAARDDLYLERWDR